jgi:hypothetical protein
VKSPLHDAPALTLGGAYTLLPVAHKYGFTKLVTKLVDYVKGQALLCDPQHPSKYITSWLIMAERVQLDDLLQHLVKELCQMSGEGLAQALIKPDDTSATLREQADELCSDTRNRLLALITSRLRVEERDHKRLRTSVADAETSATKELVDLRGRLTGSEIESELEYIIAELIRRGK